MEMTMADLRGLLRTHLENVDKLRKLSFRINHCTPNEGALYMRMQSIPCILHLEMRVGLKLVWMLLNEGLNNAKGKFLEKYESISET